MTRASSGFSARRTGLRTGCPACPQNRDSPKSWSVARPMEGLISQGRAAAAENGFAPIFVTGLPRSGTTLVEQIIAAHSDVESGGELGFASYFCRALQVERPGRPGSDPDPDVVAGIGRDYTKAIGRRFPGARHVTDKSIYTFEHIGALKLALPNARFVVVATGSEGQPVLDLQEPVCHRALHGYAYDLERLARYYDEFECMIDLMARARAGLVSRSVLRDAGRESGRGDQKTDHGLRA